MNKIIIHPIPTGVAVTYPTGQVPIEEVAAQVAPDGIYAIVTADAIPTDRTFRNAWVYDEGSIEIDLARAKAIAHDIRRRRRAEELAPERYDYGPDPYEFYRAIRDKRGVEKVK